MFTGKNIRFVEVLQYYGYWIVFLGRKHDRIMQIGMGARGVMFGLSTALMIRKLAQEGIQCIINGTLMYFPTMIYALVFPTILFLNRKHFVDLLNDFEDCWAFFEDEKDKQVFERYYKKIWKILPVLHMCLIANVLFYVVMPISVDSLFHYVFDWLSQPLILTYPHMGYLPENRTWDGRYYAIAVVGSYCIYECLAMQLGWVVMYLVIVAYCYPVLLVTKQAFRDIQPCSGDPDSLSLRKALRAHQLLVNIIGVTICHYKECLPQWRNEDVSKLCLSSINLGQQTRKSKKIHIAIRLNEDLKAFLGLPCAFETLFVSLTLTLTAFTTVTSTDVLVVSAYCSGMILHFSAGLLYCSLGQLLENKSEELSIELYNLRWYSFSPSVRRNLNMMIRQARKTFVIDFHGDYKFNLENFMTILSSSYSYFTIIQTLTAND